MPPLPRCPACAAATTEIWRRAPASEPGLPVSLLLRCPTCGTAVTADAPKPDDLHETGAYAPGRPRGAGVAAPLLAAFDRRRLGFLHPWVPAPAVLLDVGAGRGRFVASARTAGYDARGLEPSLRGVDAAREVYGVELVRAGLQDAEVEAGSVDGLSLWHVLEHVEDPAAALVTLRGWLSPGGVLLVGVPNLDSLQARIGGRRWYHLDLPRHRTHFTARGLRLLLARNGFEVVAEHHVLLEHNPFGLWQSAVSRVTSRPSYLYNLLKRNAPVSADLIPTLLALPLVPLALVVELLAGLARRGGTLALVAQPRPTSTSAASLR